MAISLDARLRCANCAARVVLVKRSIVLFLRRLYCKRLVPLLAFVALRSTGVGLKSLKVQGRNIYQ